MKKWLILLAAMMLLLGAIGCSDDDDGPTGGGNTSTETSVWNATGGYWNSNIDATSTEDFTYFSFTTKDTVTIATAKPADGFAAGWDIAFRREEIKTNGGAFATNGGDVEAVSLGARAFDGVTIADTNGVSWESDVIEHFIDEWYDYNPVTHSLTMNQNVYSMVDASGEHYVKFQVDSIVGGGAPPAMGTVYMKYFYQSAANSLDLSGSTTAVSFTAGSTPVYFDFSSGGLVTPSDPTNSLEWDLSFFSYEIGQNSGPNGTGDCAAFLAWGELTDPTDIDGFTAQPGGAPLFPDIAGSALTDWYTYTGPPLHQLPSNSEVYLLKTGDKIYKLRIESYYGEDGASASGNYNFIWAEL